MPITTVPNCKAFRNIEGDNREHDAELERLIPAVQQFLEEACERTFDRATVTEYYNGAGSGACASAEYSAPRWRNQLILARPPIVSIANLWDDPLRTYAASTLIPASSYVIASADAGLVVLEGRCFSQGLQNIKITYIGGFLTMPADLEQAAIEMVWAAREKGSNNLVGVRSRSVADGNVQYMNLSWGSLADDIISKYRLHLGVA